MIIRCCYELFVPRAGWFISYSFCPVSMCDAKQPFVSYADWIPKILLPIFCALLQASAFLQHDPSSIYRIWHATAKTKKRRKKWKFSEISHDSGKCSMIERYMFKNLTSFSLSLSSASFSLTRRTNIWRISSSLLCNSAKWFERFASNVCWNETWKARAWQKIQIIV